MSVIFWRCSRLPNSEEKVSMMQKNSQPLVALPDPAKPPVQMPFSFLCSLGWRRNNTSLSCLCLYLFSFCFLFCFTWVWGGGVSYKLKKCSLWHQQRAFMLLSPGLCCHNFVGISAISTPLSLKTQRPCCKLILLGSMCFKNKKFLSVTCV